MNLKCEVGIKEAICRKIYSVWLHIYEFQKCEQLISNLEIKIHK